MAPQHIAVLGAGSWGTALALQAVRAGHRVKLWGRRRDHLAEMADTRENQQYLPGTVLPDALGVEPELDRALARADGVLIATPSHAFTDIVSAIAGLESAPPVLWATKGFEAGSGRLLHTLVEAQLGAEHPAGIATGPSFAREVAAGLPTALTVASRRLDVARSLATWLHAGAFRTYTSDDLIGAQVGGALKNVLAIAAGISDGLRYGANARAALITRGLAELTRIGVALGGRRETLAGLTGLGDLLLTATDDQSRNRRYGLALAAGQSAEQAQAEIGQVVEGHTTTLEAYRLSQSLGIDAPIVEQVYAVLYSGRRPADAVQALLAREVKAESA